MERTPTDIKSPVSFKPIDQEDIMFFVSILGKEAVLTDQESRQSYGSDETEDLNLPPEVVLIPRTTEQVSEIMGYCHEHLIAVTPIGALTGLSGGALSIMGGVGLSMRRFNRIIEIDEANLQATVEPGVITQVFQEAVLEKGLFYPPDPASRGSCTIGGNLAESSGGPKAVKYGVTRDYIINLEVVLADGTKMWTGANVLKNATGYDLTRLIVGSEGTLAVITKAVFRLIPRMKFDLLMLVPFQDAKKACEAVSATFRAGITPSSMEFMERDALLWVNEFIGGDVAIPDEIQAHLLIEVDGNYEETLFKDCEIIAEVMEAHGSGEILFASSASEKDKLWLMRRKVAEAVKANSIYKEEDTVVPRFKLPELLDGVKRIGAAYGFKSVCYGHAGDGNLHVNIIKGQMSDEDWNNKLTQGIRELFRLVVDLGGTISGEHGIGLVQKDYMDIAFKENELELMRSIKRVFDTKGILNPMKIF
jgi:glycolate oxidase